jgi:hypothetical protein
MIPGIIPCLGAGLVFYEIFSKSEKQFLINMPDDTRISSGLSYLLGMAGGAAVGYGLSTIVFDLFVKVDPKDYEYEDNKKIKNVRLLNMLLGVLFIGGIKFFASDEFFLINKLQYFAGVFLLMLAIESYFLFDGKIDLKNKK